MNGKTWFYAALAVLIWLFNGGCLVDLSHHGEVGFALNTEWKFFHRAEQTTDERATAELRPMPLTAWFGEEEGPPASTPSTITD